MSIDNTVNELSNTLSELGRLVNHINSQISGITGRINKTLDNFDDSVAKVAGDASSVTGQLTDTVSQVPNSWVFYLLLITLCIVFILLSIVLSLNLVTKMHAIWVIFKGRVTSENGFNDSVQAPVAVQRRIGSGNEQPGQLGPPSGRQGIYHLDSGTTSYTTRSLKSQEV